MPRYWTTVFCNGSSDWSKNNTYQGKQLAAANRQRYEKSNMQIGCQPRVFKEQIELGTLSLKRNLYLCIFQADGPIIPSDLKGETFSHVFGTNTSR